MSVILGAMTALLLWRFRFPGKAALDAAQFVRHIVDVGRPDYERDACLLQDLAAARRTGGEHQHAFMLAVMLAV